MAYKLIEGKPAWKMVRLLEKLDNSPILCWAIVIITGLALGGIFAMGMNEIHPL